MRQRERLAAAGAAILLATSTVAEVQWVFLAHRAIGRVEQMSQSAPGGGASYDTAVVILEVPAEQVYDAIKKRLMANADVKVTRADDVRRAIEFTDGQQIGGIQVSALGDGLSHLMVSTAHPGVTASTTSVIVERILAVCKELNVECERTAS